MNLHCSSACGQPQACSELSTKPVLGTRTGEGNFCMQHPETLHDLFLGMHLVIRNQALHAGLSSSDDVSTEETIPFGTWSHFAMQYNHLTGEQSLFINGQLNKSAVAMSTTVGLDEALELLLGQTKSSVLSGAWMDEV